MPGITSKCTIYNSTRSDEVNFRESVIGQFLYTHLAITGSPTGVETEQRFERVFGLKLNRIAILSYRIQSHVYCLSTE